MMDEQLLDTGDIAVYLAAVDWLSEILALEEVAASWTKPSALKNCSVGGLAAHAVMGGLIRLNDVLQAPHPMRWPCVSTSACSWLVPNSVIEMRCERSLGMSVSQQTRCACSELPRGRLAQR